MSAGIPMKTVPAPPEAAMMTPDITPSAAVTPRPGTPTARGSRAAMSAGIPMKTVPAPPEAAMMTPEAVSPAEERKRFFAFASGAHCWACWATEVTAC